MGMKATKATKALKAGGALTQSAINASVAESTCLEPKQVKGILESIIFIAAEQPKKKVSFKLAGMLNRKLKKKPATPARNGVNPFTKQPCVWKAKPASKTVKVYAMKRLKEAIN